MCSSDLIPPMSLGEYRAVKGQLKDKGIPKSNHAIIDALAVLHQQVDESQEKSKKARRSAQRKKVHKKAGPIIKKTPKVTIPDEGDFWDEDVEAFD